MQYLFLICAIVFEVIATLSLRVAAMGHTKLYAAATIGYIAAFLCLLVGLRQGLPLGIAYGIWTASGVAITAIASKYIFSEPLTRRMLGGITLIVVGVLFLELGGRH
ncbi:DMT family transporter [Nocardia neocaledoniensis]|uniref:DMT family transporter n=1 Tax=Nocardia neocaledoniensis TaxID=236511 RepID=UPI0024580286|nr:SMR family transporter [Nocardia neocaledoniensis]